MGKILPILVCLVLLPRFSAAEDQGEGKRLYQSYCTGCHGSFRQGRRAGGQDAAGEAGGPYKRKEDEPIF